jgi:hypothetical protein
MPTSATTPLRNTLRYLRTSKIVKGVSSIILMAVFIIKAIIEPSRGSIFAAVFVTVLMLLTIAITYGMSESNHSDSDQEPPGSRK